MPHANPWETADKIALEKAMLAMYVCPRCRNDLRPVAFCEDVWGCAQCRETWYLPDVDRRVYDLSSDD